MRRATFLALMAASLASGCADPPGDAAPKQQANANPGCHINEHNGRVRAGDNVPIHMAVRNDGKWCFAGIAFSGSSAGGSRLVNQPDHGDTRLFVRDATVIYGYRPKPGYAGGDSFLFTMPSGFGYETNIAVTVDVAPAS